VFAFRQPFLLDPAAAPAAHIPAVCKQLFADAVLDDAHAAQAGEISRSFSADDVEGVAVLFSDQHDSPSHFRRKKAGRI
jgi:hypothetical protein